MNYKNMILYEEPCEESDVYRANYYNSINKYLDSMIKRGENGRANLLENIHISDIPRLRNEYIQKLGKPLNHYSFSVPNVSKKFVAKDDLCSIFRLTFHLDIDIEFYGILCLPNNTQTPPLAIMQHGGGGTPELCMDFHGKNNYDNVTKKLLEKGIAVFSPQLLLWCFKDNAVTGPNYKLQYDRRTLDLLLKLHGSGIVPLEIYSIKKAIDFFSVFEEVDTETLGMMGASYGGLFTLYTMAADTRIKVGYSCAAFNNRIDTNKINDFLFPGFGNSFLDAEIGALCLPRKILIDVGKEDSVFDYKTAIIEFDRLQNYAKQLGCEKNLSFNLWDGGHRIDVSGNNFNTFTNEILKKLQ